MIIVIIHIHIHIPIHIHIHTYVRTYVRTYVHTYVRTYIRTYILYTHIYIYIYIYIYLRYIVLRGKRLHAGNRHLRNRGFSVAFSNGCSVACSNIIALVSGMFHRIVTFPVDSIGNVQRMFSGVFQWNLSFESSGV